MLSVKIELLESLAQALEKLSPGAGAKAAFESPKVAAHGDLATTAAMQLAKPLKLNPRQLAEELRDALLAKARQLSAQFSQGEIIFSEVVGFVIYDLVVNHVVKDANDVTHAHEHGP